jgi:AraC family transcriptional regulator, carnitine catabolism transcriptional activator
MDAERVGLFLVPNFALASLSAATEPLRMANRVAGRPLYTWHVISADDQPVASTAGVDVCPGLALDQAKDLSFAFVIASREGVHYDDPRVLAWLRRLAACGVRLGGIGCGTFVLARAGLLEGYRCTTHWEQADQFAVLFPKITLTGDLYCIDHDRVTSAGLFSAIDLMLALIAERHGERLAIAAADLLVHTHIRSPKEHHRMPAQWRYRINDKRLARAITLMEKHIETPLSTTEITGQAAVSARQLERLFQEHLGCAPMQFYLQLRLRRAQTLLRTTDAPVTAIAAQCGFSSASHLARVFRRNFGLSPVEVRYRTPVSEKLDQHVS